MGSETFVATETPISRGGGSAAMPRKKSEDDALTAWLVRHRWAVVVPVVLPLSKLYAGYWRVRHVLLRELMGRASAHDARVKRVVAAVRAWNDAGRHGLICTSRKAWQSVSVRALDYKKTGHGIDVPLHDILEVDERARTVRVEPRVNMGQLSHRLVPKGFTVPVVPELDDLTAGGLLLGYGIESSSHKYGLFADTVRACEVVLGDGRVVRASKEEHADLFHALPFSYGAHGLVTALELPIIPCKPYVRVTYEPVTGLDAICARFTELATSVNPPEFLDAILFARDRGVLVHGDFADLPEGAPVNHIGRFYKPWFYKHVESFLARGAHTEHVPLRDYYHRYTRSLYFHGELLVPFGNHPVFRALLGWLMPPKVSFMRLVQTKRARAYRDARNVVQDALVPIRHLREGIELFHREFECYPLWLCGHKLFRTEPRGMLSPRDPAREHEMYVDIGAWQVPGFVKRGEPWDGHAAVRRMEAWLREHRGYQCLYAVTEQTREELFRMFDGTLYENVRKAYGAEGAFMDLYDKVKRTDG